MEPADFTHSEAVDPDGRLRLEIQADQAGSRVDRVLGRALAPHYSRSYLSALLAEGAIKVDGQSVRTSFRVAEGMLIEGELGVLAKSLPEAEDLELKILHEDESVILVDKPQGLVIHPGSGAASGTMVNGLLKLFPELSVVGRADRPGIVHRLDRETTGIMVVARTNDAARSLVNQFKAKTVRKQYAAVVWGEMPFDSDWIDLPIGQHPRKPQRRAVVAEGGQAASTFYEVRQRLGVASVLDGLATHWQDASDPCPSRPSGVPDPGGSGLWSRCARIVATLGRKARGKGATCSYPGTAGLARAHSCVSSSEQ